MNRKIKLSLVILSIIVILSTIFIIFKHKSSEYYNHFGIPSDIQEGLYNIINKNNIPLASNLITTVQCNDFLFNSTIPTNDTAWKLKRVAKGIYILMKPSDKECLYTSPDNSIRSYYFPNCSNSKNLCGIPSIDYKGEIDEGSLHTYFMLLQNPDGKYYIKSMINDKYICMNNSLSLVDEPTTDCIFTINKI